ncbi:MAG: GNAT family N-acetyltransferase [Marinomonas sp.]
MKLELLNEKHLTALMDFELENRLYFESLIASRGNDFYRRPVVLAHIRDLVSDYDAGEKLSCLVIQDDEVIARANIKDIDDEVSTAEVGYRVAESAIGKGVASFALASLIELAKTQLGLKSLTAWVMSNNPASARVLEKQGFVELETLQNHYCFNRRYLACTQYRLNLDR